MKLITCLILLVTSQFSHAISASEQECVTRTVYHEARSLPQPHWIKVANVIYNRSKHFKTYHFGSRSPHLCDVVRSPQFTSNKKLDSKILEPKVYQQIRKVVQAGNWQTNNNILFFETKKGKMIYNNIWSK